MGFDDGAPTYATLDNAEMLQGVKGDYIGQASAYEDSTNVFVPYYRQTGMSTMYKARKETGDVDAAISGDITAALNYYYFEHYNNGHPFIIAGDSQGSAMTKLVLKKYFNPDYYKRMIAAYVIGFAVTKDDIEENPHWKFASGKSDTGEIEIGDVDVDTKAIIRFITTI